LLETLAKINEASQSDKLCTTSRKAVKSVSSKENLNSRPVLGDVTNTGNSNWLRRVPVKPKKSRSLVADRPLLQSRTVVNNELPVVPESPAGNILTEDEIRNSKSPILSHKRAISAVDIVKGHRKGKNDDQARTYKEVKSRKSWRDLSTVINGEPPLMFLNCIKATTSGSKSSLPAVQQAVRNVQMAAENRLDRMTIWIRSVEGP
jgi:hypothetical protein